MAAKGAPLNSMIRLLTLSSTIADGQASFQRLMPQSPLPAVGWGRCGPDPWRGAIVCLYDGYA